MGPWVCRFLSFHWCALRIFNWVVYASLVGAQRGWSCQIFCDKLEASFEHVFNQFDLTATFFSDARNIILMLLFLFIPVLSSALVIVQRR